MNDCPNGEIRDLLPDLLHDRLALGARRLVESHVSDCALCQQELELLRGMSRALRRTPVVNVDDIAAAIPAYRAPRQRTTAARAIAGRSGSGWRIAAAIIFIAAGGTSIAVARHRDVAPRGSTDAASAQSRAPATRELVIASATVGDLDERELSTLLQDIESIDAVPSVEPEPGYVSPIVMASPSGTD